MFAVVVDIVYNDLGPVKKEIALSKPPPPLPRKYRKRNGRL